MTDADDPNLAYAFAAVPGTNQQGTCGTCFEVLFTGTGYYSANDAGCQALVNKRLIVQATNIGHDVSSNQFDVMIPGGGVGLYDACTTQWQIEERGLDLGAQYGGFASQCMSTLGWGQNGYNDLISRKQCIRDKCNAVFGGSPFTGSDYMLQGCLWYVDWYEAADNPNLTFQPIACPSQLSSRSGFARDPACYQQTGSTCDY